MKNESKNRKKRNEEILVDILSEKNRRSFIMEDLTKQIIEVNITLKKLTEEILQFQDYAEDDFDEKIMDLYGRITGLKKQADYLASDDNIKDVNQRADTYIDKIIEEFKARIIVERNRKDNK